MSEIDISTRVCSHTVADIALPLNIYNNLKRDMISYYQKNQISFDLIEFKNSKYVNDGLPNREKIIVNMQVDEDDYEALLTICNKNKININKLYNATFFEFSVLEEYSYTTPVAS